LRFEDAAGSGIVFDLQLKPNQLAGLSLCLGGGGLALGLFCLQDSCSRAGLLASYLPLISFSDVLDVAKFVERKKNRGLTGGCHVGLATLSWPIQQTFV
jgi:hypothetical protein